MQYWEAILLAIVEGLTEFLPVSSTGHLILSSAVLGLEPDEFVKMFTVAVQPGAIAAVLVLYWRKFFQTLNFYWILFVAFIPAAIFGLAFSDTIDNLLESPLGVAISLVIGGGVFLFIDKWFENNEKNPDTNVDWKKALVVGFFQVLSLIPGTSRSGATIVGGLVAKLNRKQAAEFSFFLAVPTLFAATGYKCLKYQSEVGFNWNDMNLLLVGNLFSFVVAIFAIKGFIKFLTSKGFKLFGWYRIILGSIIILILLVFKVDLAVV